VTELMLDLASQSELLQKKSLKGEVFELLHHRIVAGKYSPGEWLRQEEIATQLGVSQTPVREALDLLVSVGLAERVPYRGVRVPELTQQEILDAYAARMILERATANLAALHSTQEQLVGLTSIVERTKNLLSLDDISNLRQLNRQFHQSIARACGNSLLAQLYELAANRFPDWMLYEYMFRHPELLQASLEKEYREHHLIAEAISSRDSALTESRVTEHIINLGCELIDYLGIPEKLLHERDIIN
jgi:DNA-binding GntR family transcriptional regulator